MITRNLLLILCIATLFQWNNLTAQLKVSNKSSNWSNATAWTPSGVPTATNQVLISDGHTMSMDVNGACSTLSVGTGGSACSLRFSGNSALTLTVSGTLLVNTNGTVRIRSSSNATHTLNLKGNVINNGIMTLVRDANSLCDLAFTNNGNQIFSGNGSSTVLNKLQVNMGASQNNLLDVTVSALSAPNGFLDLRNGTFRLSVADAISLVPFVNTSTIVSTSGIWMNSPSAMMNASAALNLSGKATVSSGTLVVGNSADEDLISSGGNLTINGGILKVAGKYLANTAASTFSISSGMIYVADVGSTNTSLAPFHLSASGSQFNMTGGSIVLAREGGNGTQDLGFSNTGSTSGIVSGGTIQIGSGASPASQTIGINSTYSVGNLVVNSSNVTAKLSTSLNVSGGVSIVTGSLDANNQYLGLGGSWFNSGTFTPGTGTVNFSSAAAQSIYKSGGENFNHLFFAGTGVKTFSCPLTVSGNFSLATGASVDVSAANYSLALKGNFYNSGSLNARSALVSLIGTSTQSLGGTSVTSFYDLTLNNASGCTLLSAQNLQGSLNLLNGTFNSNSQAFTLISNGLTTARIAQIQGTGNTSGNFTFQRYVPGGSTGWALLGNPVSSTLTLNDWDDDIFISCPTCPDGSAGGFLSIYSYDETVGGLYDNPAAYVSLNTINDAVLPGKGYWVYLGTSQYTTSAITVDVTGSVRKFNYTIPLQRTNTGSAANDGWNLINNPYPSAISWASLKGATSNIDNAIYVYNADLNSGTGGFASYVNGVSSPAVGSGGVGDNIPMFQGFYVHSTGATSLSALESNKTVNNPTFLKPNNSQNSKPLMRLNLRSAFYSDEAVLYVESGSTSGFEEDYDAYKLRGQDPYAPYLALVQNSEEFQINAVPPVNGNFTMALKSLTGYSGTYTIGVVTEGFPMGACIQLFDKQTSQTTDLVNNEYSFFLSDTTATSRFVLSITINTLNILSSQVIPNCVSPTIGKVIASGTSSGPWDFVWKQNGAPVRSVSNRFVADTLNAPNGGTFELELHTAGLCDGAQSTFHVDSIKIPLAQIYCPDTLYLSVGDSAVFNNLSVNSVSQTWTVSDGAAVYTSVSPVHHFSAPGVYSIGLKCMSSSSCESVAARTITVLNTLPLATGTEFGHESGRVIKTLGPGVYEIEINGVGFQQAKVSVLDVTGRLLKQFTTEGSGATSVHLDLSSYSEGVYLVTIADTTQSIKLKLPNGK